MDCARGPEANPSATDFLAGCCRRKSDRNCRYRRGLDGLGRLWAVSLTVVVVLLLSPYLAKALDLNGVLVYAADPSGNLSGPVWHTASGYGGRPLGFTRWPPPGHRGMPFPIGSDGSLRDKEGRPALGLWPGSHVTHLFWQFRPGEFPSALVLNLYFNGDLFSPGISILINDRYGLTHFAPNPSSYTLAMDLSLAPNPAAAEFSDGAMRARVTAAFFFSSSPSLPDLKQWRPTDFVNLDRVGVDSLSPDGLPDGVLIFQFDVLPEGQSSQGSSQPFPLPHRILPPAVQGPAPRLLGPSVDVSLPNPAPSLATSTPVRTADVSAPAAERTSTFQASGNLKPTPAALESSEAPEPTAGTDPTPQATTATSPAPTPEPTAHPRSPTHGTPTQPNVRGTPTRGVSAVAATGTPSRQSRTVSPVPSQPTPPAKRLDNMP